MRLPKLFRRKATLGSIFDRPCNVAIASAGNSNKQMVAAGASGLLGCVVRESAGAVTAWRIHDGSLAGSTIAILGAPANSVGSPVLPSQGVAVPSGAIFLENVSGSGEVVVYWG